MNKTTAINQGLDFTGIYERFYNKDIVKAKAAAIRKKYKCRAVVVDDDGGCSVYADKIFCLSESIGRLEKTAEQYHPRRERLKQKFEDALKELDQDEQKTLLKITEYEKELKDLRKK